MTDAVSEQWSWLLYLLFVFPKKHAKQKTTNRTQIFPLHAIKDISYSCICLPRFVFCPLTRTLPLIQYSAFFSSRPLAHCFLLRAPAPGVANTNPIVFGDQIKVSYRMYATSGTWSHGGNNSTINSECAHHDSLSNRAANFFWSIFSDAFTVY